MELIIEKLRTSGHDYDKIVDGDPVVKVSDYEHTIETAALLYQL